MNEMVHSSAESEAIFSSSVTSISTVVEGEDFGGEQTCELASAHHRREEARIFHT